MGSGIWYSLPEAFILIGQESFWIKPETPKIFKVHLEICGFSYMFILL